MAQVRSVADRAGGASKELLSALGEAHALLQAEKEQVKAEDDLMRSRVRTMEGQGRFIDAQLKLCTSTMKGLRKRGGSSSSSAPALVAFDDSEQQAESSSSSKSRAADNDEKMKEDVMERAKKTEIPLAKLAETYFRKNEKRVPEKHANDIVYIVHGLSAWSDAPKLPSGLPDGWQWRINVCKKTLVSLYRSPDENPKLFHKLQHARFSCLASGGGKRKASSDPQAAAAEKKKRKKKDPNAPKKPMTSYFLFQNELRRKHKEEGSSIRGKEFSKLASAKWKTLDQAEKKRYKDQYDILMVEFSKKKSDYEKKSSGDAPRVVPDSNHDGKVDADADADSESSSSSDSDSDSDTDSESLSGDNKKSVPITFESPPRVSKTNGNNDTDTDSDGDSDSSSSSSSSSSDSESL